MSELKGRIVDNLRTRRKKEDIGCNFSKIKNSKENKVKLHGQKVSKKDNF